MLGEQTISPDFDIQCATTGFQDQLRFLWRERICNDFFFALVNSTSDEKWTVLTAVYILYTVYYYKGTRKRTAQEYPQMYENMYIIIIEHLEEDFSYEYKKIVIKTTEDNI